jgi:hypothetical protein
LAKSAPIAPQNVLGQDASPVVGLDIGELAARVAALQGSFAAAVSQLNNATQALTASVGTDPGTTQSAIQAVRNALIVVADHGIGSAYPLADGTTTAATSAQADAVLASVRPLAATAPPPSPDATASDSVVGS